MCFTKSWFLKLFFFNQATLGPAGSWVLLVAPIFSQMKWSLSSLQGLHLFSSPSKVMERGLSYRASFDVWLIDTINCILIVYNQ